MQLSEKIGQLATVAQVLRVIGRGGLEEICSPSNPPRESGEGDEL